MSHENTSRNLLLGLLALQNNFINRHALVAAFGEWVGDKSHSLAEILVEHRALDAAHCQLLDALVAAHIQVHDGDTEKSLTAVSSLGSLRHYLAQVADPDVQRSLARVPRDRPTDGDADATRPVLVGAATAAGTRFRILRPHARGGLGEVYVAEDGELHREVALKEIQEHHADDPASRSRFLLEAQITGGLEHPGIVPVYGLGTYADGRPFYAMRFIKGDSLKEAIERFHGKREQVTGDREQGAGHPPPATHHTPSFSSIEFRKLLARFIDVCNAVEYAHSRGVLHRDLKPGNIMLGKYGETLVVDWGLAKAAGRSDGERIGSDEPTLRPAAAGASAPTQMGSAIGTPQYMSPEQAEGRPDLLGPATDVYSLGATLYTLVTGRPAFGQGELAETLSKVANGDFPPPRQVEPGVPRALEAICLRAMARSPGDRYGSVRALADDVEHWLADEPVSALTERTIERLGRWGRRHRSWVRAGMAAVALVCVVSAVSLVVVERARRATARAKDLAELNEQLAMRHKRAAVQNARWAEKNAATARENEKRANKYAELARANEEKAKQSAAEALHNAEVAKQNEKTAKDQHDRAANQFVALANELEGLLQKKRTQQPTGPELRALQDEILNLVGRNVLMLAQAFDDSHLSDFSMVVNFQRLGNLLARLGYGAQALREYEQGYQLAKQLADAAPDDDLAHANLALMRIEMGKMTRELNDDTASALAYALESRDLQEQVRSHPRNNHPFKPHDHDRLLALYEREAGECELRLGRPAQARKHLEAALAHRLSWVEKQPGDVAAISWLSEAYLWMGMAAWHLHDSEAVEKNFGEGLRIIHALIEKYPTAWDFQGDLAEVEGAYGDAKWRLGNPEAAREWYEKSMAHDTTALEHLGKDSREYIGRYALLALAHERLGAIDRAGGDAAAAQAHYAKALAIRTELSDIDPLNLSWQAAQALTLAQCGDTLAAVKKAQDVVRRAPRGASLLLQAARCYARCAAGAANEDERKQDLELAFDALRRATNSDFHDSLAIKTDPDLGLLCDEPAWKMLLGQLEGATEKEQGESP